MNHEREWLVGKTRRLNGAANVMYKQALSEYNHLKRSGGKVYWWDENSAIELRGFDNGRIRCVRLEIRNEKSNS